MRDYTLDPAEPKSGRIAFYPPTKSPVSWWLDCDRASLQLLAHRERQRMRNTREFDAVQYISLAKMSAPLPGTAKRDVAGERLVEGLKTWGAS